MSHFDRQTLYFITIFASFVGSSFSNPKLAGRKPVVLKLFLVIASSENQKKEKIVFFAHK